MDFHTRGRSAFAAAIAALALCVPGAHAETNGHPSSKVTVRCSDAYLMEATESQDWTTIMFNTLKVANNKDLLIRTSLESALYTSTEVQSKGGNKDTSIASAAVQVRVLVDGNLADPGEVTFASRSQTLEAVFQGLTDGCWLIDELGNIILDEDCVEPESVGLILDTMTAGSFEFMLPDCPAGVHMIQVQARVSTNTTFQEGGATAIGCVGRGSMAVEEVRLLKDEEIEISID